MRKARHWVAAVALAGWASAAAAQPTTTAAASILLFPRVAASDAEDTLIQIVNNGFLAAYLRCAYVTPGAAPIAFEISLGRRQPTHWVVSRGRTAEIAPTFCSREPANTDRDSAGLFVGEVPAAPPAFAGLLACVQVDRSGAALSGRSHRSGDADDAVQRRRRDVRRLRSRRLRQQRWRRGAVPGRGGRRTLCRRRVCRLPAPLADR